MAADRPGEPRRYEVLAVRYATRRARRHEFFHHWESYGEPDVEVEMAYYFWVLRAGGETILVDTGFDPAVGTRRGRTLVCEPVEALRRAGVEPDSVSTVIITHFHYDHIGNIAAFPGAALVAPRRELELLVEVDRVGGEHHVAVRRRDDRHQLTG